MFGHKKKLLASGAQTEGVVMNLTMPRRQHLSFSVRVKFPDGSTGQFEVQGIYAAPLGPILEGTVVPVRYDTADHSEITLDTVLMEQRRAEQVANWKSQAAAGAEAKFGQLGTDQAEDDAPRS
jgi:hypothetical protein